MGFMQERWKREYEGMQFFAFTGFSAIMSACLRKKLTIRHRAETTKVKR